MEKIVNLTQHPATPVQVSQGVENLPPETLAEVKRKLTFNKIPSMWDIDGRAFAIAQIAQKMGYRKAMIGGASYLMSALERALCQEGIEPLFAFSVRESREVAKEDGSVEKINVFRHKGFVRSQHFSNNAEDTSKVRWSMWSPKGETHVLDNEDDK